MQLLVLRHAKSDWGAGATRDHERPLNDRGRRAAADIGRFVARSGQLPDRVITSTAVRAADTVALAVDAGSWPCPVSHDGRLYEATVNRVLEVVVEATRDPASKVERLLVAGHEPTSSELVAHLTGARVRFPTAALAAIDLPIADWSELVPGASSAGLGVLRWLVVPKLVGPLLEER